MNSPVTYYTELTIVQNDNRPVITPNYLYPNGQLDLWKQQIDQFVELEHNWDGYGGVHTDASIASNAKSFISMLDSHLIDRISDIFPNSHGTLTIQWENSKDEKLSLELGEHNCSYFIKYNDKDPKFFNGTDSIPALREITSDLSELLSQ